MRRKLRGRKTLWGVLCEYIGGYGQKKRIWQEIKGNVFFAVPLC